MLHDKSSMGRFYSFVKVKLQKKRSDHFIYTVLENFDPSRRIYFKTHLNVHSMNNKKNPTIYIAQ